MTVKIKEVFWNGRSHVQWTQTKHAPYF